MVAEKLKEEVGRKKPAAIILQFLDNSVFEAWLVCRPIFNATAGIKTVVIGPLPRYVTSGCCQDPEHMANRVAPGFFGNMKMDLAALNRTVKEFLHHDGYENIRAMDP
jgi:hypothetical protein